MCVGGWFSSLTDALSIRPPGQSAEEHTDCWPFPWWCVDMKAFSVTGLVLPSRWIYLFLLSLVLFPFWLLPFGFFNGWAGIISHSACTAQDVVFGELRWCSALFLNAAISGVFHNSAAWCMAPGGESALPSAEGRQSEAPIIFRIYFKLMVCVCVFFLARWKRPEWSYADLCGLADVVFIVNDEEMFCL